MKAIVCFGISFLALFLPCRVYAADNNLSNMSELPFPDTITEIFPNEELEMSEDFLEKIDVRFLLDTALTFLGSAAKKFKGALLFFVSAALISALLEKLCTSLSVVGLSELFSKINVWICAFGAYSLLVTALESVVKYINEISGFMLALDGAMASILVSGANIGSAAISSSVILGITSLIGSGSGSVFISLLRLCFSISSIALFSENAALKKISALLKNLFVKICVFVATVFATVLAFQNSIAQSADSLGARGAKYAVSNMIPIIGSGVAENLRTVSAGISLSKSVTGSFGIVIILLLSLSVLLPLFCIKAVFQISSSASAISGTGSFSSSLDHMVEICDLFIAPVVLIAVMFIFCVAVFMNTAVAIG